MPDGSELHPTLRTVVDQYLAAGHTLKRSSRSEAILESPRRWWQLPKLLALLVLAALGGGGGGEVANPRNTVRFYLDDEGEVWQRVGHLGWQRYRW